VRSKRVILLTDPPSIWERKNGTLAPGGSFREIVSLRSVLKSERHGVDTFLVLRDGSVLRESVFLQHIRSFQTDEHDFPHRKITSIKIQRYQGLVVALAGSAPIVIFKQILPAIAILPRQPRIFVSTGRLVGERLSQLSSRFGIEMTMLNRPGVARITRKAVAEIVDALAISESSPSSHPEIGALVFPTKPKN
jgi:hypothetical protein